MYSESVFIAAKSIFSRFLMDLGHPAGAGLEKVGAGLEKSGAGLEKFGRVGKISKRVKSMGFAQGWKNARAGLEK